MSSCPQPVGLDSGNEIRLYHSIEDTGWGAVFLFSTVLGAVTAHRPERVPMPVCLLIFVAWLVFKPESGDQLMPDSQLEDHACLTGLANPQSVEVPVLIGKSIQIGHVKDCKLLFAWQIGEPAGVRF